jgi:hypothetical protein
VKNHTRYLKLLLVPTVAAAGLMSAPLAGAATCQDAGSITRCQTSGSVSIKAVPGTRAPNVADSIPRGNNRRGPGIVLTW